MTWISLRYLSLLMGIIVLRITLPNLFGQSSNKQNSDHLELEWEREPKTVDEIINKLGSRNVLRDLNIDSYVFVPVYMAFFITLAFNLKTINHPAGNLLFYCIVASIMIAGISDWVENYHTYRIAAGSAAGNSINLKYYACYVKWSFIALTLALVSTAFLLRGNIWVPLAGFINVIVFVIGIIANRPLVRWGFSLMGVTLLMIAIFR